MTSFPLPLPLLVLGLGALASPLAGQGAVSLDAFPSQGQLYPRDANDQAIVDVAGRVTQTGFDHIHLVPFANGAQLTIQSQPLSYSGSEAPFSFQETVTAGLVDYRFELWLEDAGAFQKEAEADYVVCGDAFLLQGQSNTVAQDYHNENKANQHQNRWVRAFGTGSTNPGTVQNDTDWYLAEGESGLHLSGAIGGWGLRMADIIAEQAGVPVAVVNGAVGGTTIQYHLRNDLDPDDLATNYGRLLWRAQAAGLVDHAKAIFWYQGESDGGNPGPYAGRFADLYDDWNADYPALEKVYVVQIRKGCGTSDNDIFEVQRELANTHPKVRLMSSNGLPRHDSCHFWWDGYRELAIRLSRVVGRDFYGSTLLDNIDAPNLVSASFSSPTNDEITLVFEPASDTLSADMGARHDFILEDFVLVDSITAVGNTLVLDLAGPSTSGMIRYVGHSGDGPWVENARGVGVLSFVVPIL